MKTTTRLAVPSLAFITAVLVAGCASLFENLLPPAGEVGNKGLVGRLQGRDALVGLLVEGERVLAYVCDAVEGRSSLSAWFEGALEDGQFELAVVVGTTYETTSLGSVLSGTVRERNAEGTLALEDGTQFRWTADVARANTAAGLYAEGDDENLTSVIIDNAGQVRGLSKSLITGWTSRVIPTVPLRPTTRLAVQFAGREGALLRREIPLARELEQLRRVLRPKPEPLPPSDASTLMVLAALDKGQAVGHRYVERRGDTMGVPTLRLSAQLLDPNRPKNVLGPFLRVNVLNAAGSVLSTHFIDDPLSPYVEVPEGLKGESMAWLDVGREPSGFLVAAPDLKEARKIAFTRFKSNDSPIFAGTIDLETPSLEKPIGQGKRFARSAVGATGYDTDAAEHFTLAYNGPSPDRMDLLILAEGYQDTQADRDLFSQNVSNILAHLWSYSIYSEMQHLINVHVAFIPSRDANAGTKAADGELLLNDTPFQAYFDCQKVADCRLALLTSEGEQFAYEVAAGAPGNYGAGSIDTVAVLINDSRYGGAASGYGTGFMYLSNVVQAPSVFAHELGHAAFGLGDEYETVYNDDAVAASLLRPNVSAPVANRNALKWITLVHPSTDIPTEVDDGQCIRVDHTQGSGGCTPSPLPPSPDGTYQTVGMYEGAGYTACGSFRPSTACHMRCAVGHFCAVCAGAIREAFEPLIPPTVDLWMRDNTLDTGATPSPSGVGDGETGIVVKPWQSPDIRVDAPPFTDPNATDLHVHENPIAGAPHRVYVTVHNRGSLADPANAQVLLYFAPATGGAPPFPASWTLIGSIASTVPGQDGRRTVTFDWAAPANLPPHTCLIALADNDADPYPAASGGLSAWVRGSNNVTWKNVHVVNVPEIAGELSNFERQTVPIVFRIDAQSIPVGTEFTLLHEDNVVLTPYPDGFQMTLLSEQGVLFVFQKGNSEQGRFQLRTELPAGAPQSPFRSPFLLKIQLPGGTPAGQMYPITTSQFAFDPETGEVGDVIGGNTYYSVGFN